MGGDGWEGKKNCFPSCLRQHAKQPKPSVYCRQIFKNHLSRFRALKLTVCLRGLIFIGVFSCGMPHQSLAETWISRFLGSGDRREVPPCSMDTLSCPPSLGCLWDGQNCDVNKKYVLMVTACGPRVGRVPRAAYRGGP